MNITGKHWAVLGIAFLLASLVGCGSSPPPGTGTPPPPPNCDGANERLSSDRQSCVCESGFSRQGNACVANPSPPGGGGGNTALSAVLPAAVAPDDDGVAPDGNNYRSAEFNRQYGLGQTNADAAYQRGFWGQGVTVGIVDSGMLTSHIDLRDRVVPGWNFADGNANITEYIVPVSNTLGHGTFVAGIVGASRGNPGFGGFTGAHGIAPSVSLMPLQVGNRFGGFTGNIPNAFRFAVSSGVHILNNSFGLIPRVQAGTYQGVNYIAKIPIFAPLFNDNDIRAARELRDIFAGEDIVLVWAAGNRGWQTQTGNRPIFLCPIALSDRNGDCPSPFAERAVSVSDLIAGFNIACTGPQQTNCGLLATMRLTMNGVTLRIPESGADYYNLFPAFQPELEDRWLVVVATEAPRPDDNNRRFLWDGSNGCGDAKFWCIAAPGQSIYSTAGTGDNAYSTSPGTSFAAPHVSGALALLRNRLPGMPMRVARALILVAAEDLGENGVDDIYGWGFLDVDAAMTMQGDFTFSRQFTPAAPLSPADFTGPSLTLGLEPPNPATTDPAFYRTTEFGQNYGLAQIGAEYAYSRDYFGRGVTVGIVDTGMRTTHLDLRDNIVAGYNFAANNDVIDDPRTSLNPSGHGTAVGGVVAAARNNRANSAHGVAPEAKLMPLQISNRQGGLSGRGNILAAFRFAATSGVHIVNNSFGTSRGLVGMYNGQRYYANVPFFPEFNFGASASASEASQIANAVRDADMVFVWAAGNGGWNGRTGQVGLCTDIELALIGLHRCPDADRLSLTPRQLIDGFVSESYNRQLLYNITLFYDNNRVIPVFRIASGNGLGALSALNAPAVGTGYYGRMPFDEEELTHKWLVAVATDHDDELAYFSNGCGDAKFWCLAAPGLTVSTTSGTGDDAYDDANGTSFAAPHVSGALAVLKSRLSSMPMAAVRAVLLHTAEDIGDSGIDDEFGWGLVDLEKAITLQGSVRIVLDNDSRGGGGAESRRGRAGDGRADSFAVRFCFGAGGVGGNIGGGFGVWKRALQYAFGGVGGGVFVRAYDFGKCGVGYVFAFA